MFKTITYKFFGLFILLLLIYAQDPPEGFDYNQGYEQGFYFFNSIQIDGQNLDSQDWIGAFKTYDETKNGVCSQEEINFDETLGGMCLGINFCSPGFHVVSLSPGT